MPPKTPAADHVNPGFSMTKNTGRMIAAALIAPWATVVVHALRAVWYSATTPRSTPENLVYPNPNAPWEFVFLYLIHGIPTAYSRLVFFLPIYSILCQPGLISYRTIIAVGLPACVPAALSHGRSSGNDFRRILLFLLSCRAALPGCFLWITKQTRVKVTPRNRSS